MEVPNKESQMNNCFRSLNIKWNAKLDNIDLLFIVSVPDKTDCDPTSIPVPQFYALISSANTSCEYDDLYFVTCTSIQAKVTIYESKSAMHRL